MENLGDILKKLSATKSTNGGGGSSDHDGPADDSQAEEVCQLCQDRGWLTPQVPVGHPEFGEVVACQCQEARTAEERSERLLRYSNLGHLTRSTFDTLDPQGQADDAESKRLFSTAFEVAFAFAEAPKGWLVLAGAHGSGKTHLAAAIANMCIEGGRPVFFVGVSDLLDHLRASYAPTSDIGYSDLFQQVKEAPLLVLDGLGGQSATPWAEEKLQQIFNHRATGDQPTVITTAAEIADLDPFLASRILNPTLCRVLEVRSEVQDATQQLGRIDPEMLRRMTFDSFDAKGNRSSVPQRASLRAALDAARNYARDPDGWLTLFGDTGVGKTHLAVAIAVERMAVGQPVFFAFVPDLLDYLRFTFTPESRVTYDRVFDQVKNAPLLLLDDLGQESSSEWAREKLYQIVVHRHNARLPTVITSSADLPKSSGPIISRVMDQRFGGQPIRMDAPDYRVSQPGGRARGRAASAN
jgi:DNA replication protein DnaC